MSLSEFTIGARALPPPERAALASTVRLLSCLVTESVVRALYFPLVGFEATGFSVVLKPDVPLTRPYTVADVLAVLPLRHLPVFKHDGQDDRAKEIGLLDPFDMMPLVLEVSPIQNDVPDTKPVSAPRIHSMYFLNRHTPQHPELTSAILAVLQKPGWDIRSSTVLVPNKGPLSIWNAFAAAMKLDPAISADIAEEFASAVRWQSMFYFSFNRVDHVLTPLLPNPAYSFENPPPAPMFESPSIDWEESIVEGHPTHPVSLNRVS